MSFKKDMNRLDYIFLDIRQELKELGELKSNNALPNEIKEKDERIVHLLNVAALNLGIKTDGQIRTANDYNKIPELQEWLVYSRDNDETIYALTLKDSLLNGVGQKPTTQELFALAPYGIEGPWALISDYTKGNLKDEADIASIKRMEDENPVIAGLINRLFKQEDCLRIINEFLPTYLGKKFNIKNLNDIPMEIQEWIDYRTTLPEEYYTNSLPEDKAQAWETLNSITNRRNDSISKKNKK